MLDAFSTRRVIPRLLAVVLLSWAAIAVGLTAQAQQPAAPANQSPAEPAKPQPPAVPAGVTPPSDYSIGADDILTVVFWREKDMSMDVYVRPDGRISLPLLNDVQAAGLTPDQLRANLTVAAEKFFEDPTITVVVKQINSRKVYITGMISKPGPYPLMGPLTVVNLITVAGGVLEYADTENIGIVRTENGKSTRHRFNYKDFMRGKNLDQNIVLRPGDQIVVP